MNSASSDTLGSESRWITKLHARLHDPAEKPLVLMRIPGEGHEHGSSRVLRERLFGDPGVPAELGAVLKLADHWASAADRPNFPQTLKTAADGSPIVNPKTGEPLYAADWANVRFAKEAELIHPLSGQRIAIGDISDIGPQQIKSASLAISGHLIDACRRSDGSVDHRLAALAMWRFSGEWSDPARKAAEEFESDADLERLEALWSLLPADTRTPDHTIWQHLDLASAFAGALHGGDTPALLSMSIGPVQEFIAAARSTSDLWAGSHLLSRIAWEGIRVLCEQLGPEAVLMPQLRGIPQVDVWLLEMGLPRELFGKAAWLSRETDANPLFAAALPNKWLAIVPASQARALAESATSAMRALAHDKAIAAYQKLLDTAGITDPDGHGFTQIRDQLAGFPEVHWAMVPWSLAGDTEVGAAARTDTLEQTLAPFYPESDAKPGFLGTTTFRALASGDGIEMEGARFWRPNPGLLYPALHDLVERSLAAAKSVRQFSALTQRGYRCSLSGEVEWLTPERSLLDRSNPPGDRLWSAIWDRQPSWARQGERLGALATLKRMWPSLFVAELRDSAHLELDVSRFVVTTHTMAIARSLQSLQQQGALSDSQQDAMRRLKHLDAWPSSGDGRAALPRKLAGPAKGALDMSELARIPVALDLSRDDEDQRAQIDGELKSLLGGKPESYYGLLLMDGDRMGSWISGANAIPIRDTFHSRVRDYLSGRSGAELRAYLDAPRPASPGYHMAISGALNRFSLELARTVVEDAHLGRLLYAGGDDVMAMTSVNDLLPAMLALRCVYSGVAIPGETPLDRLRAAGPWAGKELGNGFLMLDRRLTRMMGADVTTAEHRRPGATASIGAVIAHHMAPLGSVLREVRRAEQRAKNEAGRDAFSLSVVKRSGGALHLTLPWQLADGERTPILHLQSLARDMVEGSRRAVFNIMEWVRDLPLAEPVGSEMLKTLMAHQFGRQRIGGDLNQQQEHARLVLRALELHCGTPVFQRIEDDAARGKSIQDFIYNYLSVADFLARDGRIARGAAQ